MITLKNVSKAYPNGNGNFYAIRNLDLEIADNEFIAIMGKSGSGKSTLLNLIGTLDLITEGEIIINEKNILQLSNKEISAFRKNNLGFIFQNFYLEPEYTLYENIELPLILKNSIGRKNRELVERVLKQVDLLDKINCKAKTLSGGEMQRAAIARALIKNPKYILADEPCGNLDTANTKIILNILKNLHAQGKTVLLVTHDENDALTAERIITLSDGRIIKDEKNIATDR